MQGAIVTVAETGAAGLALHQEKGPFDLILLDLLLPDMHGLELLQRIRDHDSRSSIVMLTSSGDVKTAIAAVQSGADGYIQKDEISSTGNHEEFIHKLEQAMQRRQGIVAQAELEQVKSDFYAMVTHDMRSPTGAINLALEMLEDRTSGPLNEFQQELVETIREGANRLLHLINNYLDLAQVERGSFELALDSVDVRAIFESCVRMAHMQAQVKDITLNHVIEGHDFVITADGERLRRLFDNLIGNAIKYTPRHGRVDVRLARNDKEITFQVTDTGYGFAQETAGQLFNKYSRLPGQASHKVAGTGLGLAIAHEIATAHGGSITGSSDGPNQGATFLVRIPVSGSQNPSQPTGRKEEAP